MSLRRQRIVASEALKLIETGECEMPIVWDDVVRRLNRHPDYPHALRMTYQGKSMTLRLLIEACALNLCQEYFDESTQ